MFLPFGAEQEIAAAYAARERIQYEYMALGATKEEITQFEELVRRIAYQTIYPNHLVIDQGYVLGKRRLSMGDPLLPKSDEIDIWVRQFVQAMFYADLLTSLDPYQIYVFMQTCKRVLSENIAS